MKRIILLLLVLSVMALALIGCSKDEPSEEPSKPIGEHVHDGGMATCASGAICAACGEVYTEPTAHRFAEASCSQPKTCLACGATEGETLPHDFSAPNCVDPKTCSVCGATEGNANGHNWVNADCDTPKTCSTCGTTEGNANGHSWVNADCDTPKTCSTCGTTEGNANGHSWVNADCDTPKTCSVCGTTEGNAKGHNWVDADCDTPKTCAVCGTTEGAPTHSYKTAYDYHEDGHWLECSRCGDKKNEGSHFGGEMTETERAICEVCNAHYGKEPIVIKWLIEATSPLNGSTFTLANDRVNGWYDGYDFATTDTDAHWLEEDIFLPECPVFTWTVGENALYYKLYISTSEDMSNATCYLTSTTSLTVEHLYVGTTYYWYVDAVYGDYTVRSRVFSFSTASTPRTVDIDGVSNARDLGGYVTVDGKVIKQGMIYRSAKLDDITELGEYTLLYVLGIKTDLDLRGYEETPPIEELNYVPVACPWYSTGSNHIWMNDYNKEEFAKAIKVFADIDNYPIIFHCSLGRDRTGTLAMVLGGLLGLDENTLMMEYELSVFSYWGTNGSTKYNNGLRNNIHDTYMYISNNYEGDSFSEKVESFLLEIGVTAEEIASIRSIMLEEVE